MKYRLPLLTALVFAAVYAAFALTNPLIWNSPDETAVAFFSRQFAHEGRLWALEPLNVFGGDRVHPRSIVSVEGYLVPGSFYGMMWVVGSVYRLIGTYAFALVTPLVTALAALALFFLLKRRMGEGKAYLAQLLFLAHPAVWYFASRGLFPNLLFIDFVLIGVAALYLRPWRHLTKGRGTVLSMLIDDALGVGALSIAFMIRPIEFLWLGPLLVVWLYYARKRITLARAFAAVLVIACFVTALFVTNAMLYGKSYAFGYTAGATRPGISVPALSQGSRLPASITAPRPYLLPFGFHPRAAFTNVRDYTVVFHWWYAVLALIGLFLFPLRPLKRLVAVTAFVTVVLGIYYGSGVFNDSTVPGLTVGSSYLRYFLPLFVLTIPFAAEGVWALGGWIGKKRPGVARAGIVAAVVLLNIWTVCFRSPESLVPLHATLAHYAEVKSAVLKLTAPGDLIVVERSDKIFFPDRRVMLDLRDLGTLDALPRLALFGGLYYYGITIADDEYPRLQEALAERKLQMGKIRSFGNESLYEITARQ